MYNFSFCNPTRLIFGQGEIACLAQHIPAGAKVMMTYGGGSIKSNGVYDQVMQALQGFDFVEFAGIEPNPHYETLMKAVEYARAEKVDFLLAVGGGSVIDGTKFIASAIPFESDPWSFMVNGELLNSKPSVAIGTVLTLPATGSEMNCGAVITKVATREKMAFHHEANYPRFSILDPKVCFSLPKKQITNGIADTFCHTLEQYLTYPANALVQDRFCEGVLLTLREIAPKILENPQDYDLCANFMFSATMGLNGMISMGLPQDWATHMIGHELTALYGLDHGVTLAIVGPALMQVMKSEKRAKLLQLGERVFGIRAAQVPSEDERVDRTIAALRIFYESLGIKTRLSEHGIGAENFQTISDRFAQRGWNLGENQTITPSKVVEILKAAL